MLRRCSQADRAAECQQQTAPKVDQSLVGKRLEICCDYELVVGGSEARWSAGEVLFVSNGKNMVKPGTYRAQFKPGEAAMIRWDADAARKEEVTESAARLLPSMWNPKGVQTAGGWRFDV